MHIILPNSQGSGVIKFIIMDVIMQIIVPYPGSQLNLTQGHTPAFIVQIFILQKGRSWIISVNIRFTLPPFIFLPLKLLLVSVRLFSFHLGSLWSTENFTLARTLKYPQDFGISPQHKSSCLRQQHSAGRCSSCCLWHWYQPSHTLRGPALLRSMSGWFVDIPLDAVCLHMAVRSGVAAPPLRSGSGAPCREGAEMSHCAHYAC